MGGPASAPQARVQQAPFPPLLTVGSELQAALYVGAHDPDLFPPIPQPLKCCLPPAAATSLSTLSVT